MRTRPRSPTSPNALSDAHTWDAAQTLTAGIVLGTAAIQISPAPAVLQLGAADAASPVAQALQVQSVVTATANTAGAAFTVNGSVSTGSGVGGSIIFQTSPAGGAGSTPNALVSRLTIATTKVTSADDMCVSSPHSGELNMQVLEDTVTLSGASTDANIAIPPGAIVFGCAARVISEITGATITSWTLGYTGSLTAFGSLLGLPVGSTNIGNIGGQGFYGAPTAITFTPTGGTFTGGVVRIMLYYFLPVVPAS